MTPQEAKECITYLLTICPHPCRLRKLLRDFRKLKGHNMPLFGFDSHLDLLRTFNDIVVVLDAGNERNPEIRLIRRDPLPPTRPRDIYADWDDDEDLDSEPSTIESNHNPTLPDVLFLQDFAHSRMLIHDSLDSDLDHIHNHGHDHGHVYRPKHRHAHCHAHGCGYEASDEMEDFRFLDDDVGLSEEEQENWNEIWEMEREISVTFVLHLWMNYMVDSVKSIWNKVTRNVSRFVFRE